MNVWLVVGGMLATAACAGASETDAFRIRDPFVGVTLSNVRADELTHW